MLLAFLQDGAAALALVVFAQDELVHWWENHEALIALLYEAVQTFLPMRKIDFSPNLFAVKHQRRVRNHHFNSNLPTFLDELNYLLVHILIFIFTYSKYILNFIHEVGAKLVTNNFVEDVSPVRLVLLPENVGNAYF